MQLTELQIRLAEQLLLAIKKPEKLQYNELASRINPPINPRLVGKNIEKISILCHELGLPLISAMVISKGQGKVGEGFYRLYEECGIPTGGKTNKELFHEELKSIFACREWYKLEDYLGLHVGMPRPDAGLLDCRKPASYARSADVLHSVFGEQYLGKTYEGWQKGSLKFMADGQSYLIWFPKFSQDGKVASASGWVNILSEDGSVIVEAAGQGGAAEYLLTDDFRLVFGKYGSGPYQFSGVFIPDRSVCAVGYHVFRKIADVADFRGSTPEIYKNPPEILDDRMLLEALQQEELQNIAPGFTYRGKPKARTVPTRRGDRLVYPRSRQTALNALSHAEFTCEIDPKHKTFLKKQSGIAYTEPHHLVPMSRSNEFPVSLDVEENIVSLCSNCHNWIHYGRGAEVLLRKLYDERREDLARVGIVLSFDQLLSYYD